MKPNRYSAKIVIKPDNVRHDGTCALYLRVTINGKSKWHPLKKYIDPKRFDQEAGMIHRPNQEFRSLQYFLDKEKAECQKILLRMEEMGKRMTHEQFERMSRKEDVDFYLFFEKQLTLMKGKYAGGTLRSYKSDLNKCRRYKPSLEISEIDFDFIQRFEAYMREELDNETNTVLKTFKNVKAMLNRAKTIGLIKDNPFDHYVFSYEESNPTYLEEDELLILEKLYHSSILEDRLQNVLQYFLFSCYSGLRFGDVATMYWDHIKKDHLLLKQSKTRKSVIVPITPRARGVLPHTRGLGEQRVFRALTLQKSNEYLKEIGRIAGLRKKLTTHVARHTFAVISINLGISLKTVKELLGQKTLRATEIYARILDQTKFDEMKKWDKVGRMKMDLDELNASIT